MKKWFLVLFISLIAGFDGNLFAQNRFWVAAAASNWNNAANWSTTSGGAGGATIPGTGGSEVPIFNANGLGNCNLDITPVVPGITVNGYTGTIDLVGNILTTTGTNTFTSGSIINTGGSGALTLNTTLTTTFNGTTVGADVNGSTGRIFFNGSTFNGTVAITKTDNNNDSSTGNNIFNGTTTITHFGGGQLTLSNGARDQFNGVTTFNNYGSYRFLFANNHAGQTTTFASDLTLNTLKSGGGDGWSFLIAESANTNISFGGNLTINCHGPLQSNHRILQGTGTGATYGGTLTVNNTNTNAGTAIQLGTLGTSTYNGDIIVSNNGGGSGIYFNTTASASSTLADTRIISIGAGGFNSGTLSLIRFTQSGSTPQFLTATGTASLIVGPTSVFDGAVSFFAPQIFLNGGTFNDFATIEKTGAGNNTGTGGNTFASNTTINNSGTGQLRTNGGNTFGGPTNIMNNSAFDVLLESITGSTYNGDVTFSNFGASNIRVAYQGANIFNGNIIVNSTLGTGITFCETTTATTTLNGGSISIGGSGFSSGSLTLPRFTQIGGLTSNLNTFSGTTSLSLGPASSFDGLVDGLAPRIFLNGVTFLNNAQFTKTGAGNDDSAGGNIFQLTTFITNSGSGYLLMANTNPDIFNGELNITNTGSNIIYLAHNVAGNQFNGNIAVNATSGSGIYFSNNATGNSTQAALRNISIGGFGFSAGELRIRRLTQLGSEPTNLTLTGANTILRVGPATTFGGTVNFLAPRVFLDGITVNGTATIEKNGDTGNTGAGGNTFQGTTIITNSGSGELVLADTNPDTFNSATTLNNTGTSRIQIGINSAGNSFNAGLTINHGGNTAGAINTIIARNAGSTAAITGNLVLNNTNTNTNSGIIIALDGAVTINGNITVSSTSGRGIFFGNASGSVSQASGFGVSNGTFNTGTLSFSRFTQAGTVASTLNLTGSSILISGTASSFGGNVNFVAPRLLLNGATYNGTTYLEKNGAVDDAGNGGNIFNGTTTLVDSGSGYLMTANSAPDIFNGALTVTNSGSNWIYLAHNVAGNQFNNNITVNNTGSANGILFSNNASGASTFTNGTITTGGSGFSVGELRLRRFAQVGAIAQNLTLTGSSQLWIGPASAFDGNVNFVAPRLLLNGATYNGTAYLEKNGATNNDGDGGNVFNQATTIVNSGSAYLRTSNTTADIFNANLVLTNSGSSTIQMSDNAAGNQFNGNIEVNSTFGGGIYFGNSAAGTSTLAAGRTIAVGSSGVISGDIRLIRFTQLGATPQTLNLTGIAVLTLGPASIFNGNINFRAPQILLNGTTYNGTAYIEKNGATDNPGNGENTFNNTTTLVNSGSGYLMTANVVPDIFNSALTVTNTGSSIIYLAHNVAGNQFNGNITFNSTLGSGGVYFANTATGAATLGNGASLLTGGLGFSSGELRFRRFTQIGAAAQTLVLTGTSLLRIGPTSTFNGNVDFRSPQFALDGAIYNGTTYLEKTGATNNDSNGGNTFNASTTVANSGAGWFRFALTSLDTFNGNLTLTNTGSSTIRMADIVPGTVFNGNILVNTTFGGGIYFGDGGGAASLAAGKSISVGASGFTTGELRIRRFTQSDATTPQTLLLTGTASLILGPTISFSGNSDFRSPQLYLSGGVFNGTALLEKTGATDNGSNGNMIFQSNTIIRLSGTGYLRTNGSNTFNGPTSLINSGSNYLLLELTTGSTYNGDLTLTNTGSSRVRTAYTGTTAYNGNIIVNSTNGLGIFFVDNGTGSATLATGRTITVGGSGFTVGELSMPRFTQTGNTAQNIVLTGASTLRTGPATTWNGNFTASSPLMFLDGTTFSGVTNSITKTGTTTDTSVGGNVFSLGTITTITNSNTGIFRLANAIADDFFGNVIFNQANGSLQPAYNAASTFRGNVTVNGTAAITFGAAAGTATFTGTVNQNVNKAGTASPIFRTLVMNKAAGSVTMNTDALVSLTATFTSGIINTTSTNYLNFADNATATGANNLSFVDGPVRKNGNDAFTFPIGDNTFYRPAAISAPTAVGHYFIAQYVNADHGLGSAGDPTFTSISKCEYWTIDRNPGVPPASSNVLVTLSWQEAACVVGYITNPATLRVARWNGASWANHGNGGTTGTATLGTIVTSGAVTAFSPFTLASVSLANPLPVELTWFNASITKSGTGLLKWHTESELNNDRFEIERSENGVDFTSLGSIVGAGTSNQAHDYLFEDKEPILSLVYYRLKQVDFDGAFEYSSIVSLDFTSAEGGAGRLFVSPNPINSGSFASFRSGANTVRQTVTIYNNLNQEVRKFSDVEGFGTDGLTPGIYIVKNKAGEIFRLVIK